MADNDNTSVYLYFDKDGVLIYVGITGRGMTRQREHERDKPWWNYTKTQQIEHYASRQEAALREAELILTHSPPFNTQGNSDCGARDVYLAYVAGHGTRDPQSKRIPLKVKVRHGRTLIAVTDLEYATTSATIQAGGDFNVSVKGQKAKSVEVKRLGSALVIKADVQDAGKISSGELMFRINQYGNDIKRIDFA